MAILVGIQKMHNLQCPKATFTILDEQLRRTGTVTCLVVIRIDENTEN